MGTPSFRSLWRSSGLGIGAPVRVPPAGGPRPTRPSGLRADTLPTLCGGGAAARPVHPPAGSGRGNVAAGRRLRRLRPSQPPAVARATRARRKAKPASGPLRGPCPGHSPRSVAAQVLRGGPAPTRGGFGAVRPSGPARRAGVAARGPSLGVPPPSRAGAPAAGCCAALAPAGGRNLNAAR